MTAHFDLKGLFDAVDGEREQRGLTWAGLVRQTAPTLSARCIAPSTIKRFATAPDAEADGVLNVIRWLGVAPEAFVTPRPSVEALLDANAPLVRVDQLQLGLEPADATTRSTGQRTSIQRLVSVAAERGVTIAALTRASVW